MPQTLQAKDITVSLPSLSVADLELLNKVKAEFKHLSVQDVLEPIVKMVVLSPLLSIAGFFLPQQRY